MLKFVNIQLVRNWSKIQQQVSVMSNMQCIWSQNILSQQRYNFGSKLAKKPQKLKEITKSVAMSDEKSAKVSQTSQEDEQKKQEIQKYIDEEKKLKKNFHIKSQDKIYEAKLTQFRVRELVMRQKIRLEKFKDPIFGAEIEERWLKERDQLLKQQALIDTQVKQKQLMSLQKYQSDTTTVNSIQLNDKPSIHHKVIKQYYNTEYEVNNKFKEQIQLNRNPTWESRRTGVLGIKMGMTFLYDRWGIRHPLTVIQVDRCQVVQVKTQEKDGYNAMQLGVGEKSLKRLKKPEIGHYLGAGVPPKRVLCEFPVTPENFLPVGYQLSVRHFTPGQLVDIKAKTKGKGFQGGMKRWGFGGLFATHGVSVSHRSHGSTGQRQDPGKVFKNKKMAGRMGGKQRTTENLTVYKIDVPRSLIYLKGSVNGPIGGVVQIRDALKRHLKIMEYLNFPTFVYEEGKEYASELIMESPDQDPSENYYHDNDVLKDTKEEVQSTSTTTSSSS